MFHALPHDDGTGGMLNTPVKARAPEKNAGSRSTNIIVVLLLLKLEIPYRGWEEISTVAVCTCSSMNTQSQGAPAA